MRSTHRARKDSRPSTLPSSLRTASSTPSTLKTGRSGRRNGSGSSSPRKPGLPFGLSSSTTSQLSFLSPGTSEVQHLARTTSTSLLGSPGSHSSLAQPLLPMESCRLRRNSVARRSRPRSSATGTFGARCLLGKRSMLKACTKRFGPTTLVSSPYPTTM